MSRTMDQQAHEPAPGRPGWRAAPTATGRSMPLDRGAPLDRSGRPEPGRARRERGGQTSAAPRRRAERVEPWRTRPRRAPGSTLRRQRWLAIATLVVLALFALRLVWIQLYEGPSLAEASRAARTVTLAVPAQRGNILDVDGNVLATSQLRYDVAADPTLVATYQQRASDETDPGAGALAAAKALSPYLDMPVAELGALLNGGVVDGVDVRYKVVKRNVLPETWRAIQALHVPGLIGETTYVRDYPAGATAGNLLGYVNSNLTGTGGLELTLDSTLAGHAGSMTYERGAAGQPIPQAEQVTVAAQPGDDVRTTISRDIQWYAEEQATEARRKTGAEWVIVVVQDIATQAVYALADSDPVNPNDTSVPADERGSMAVQGTFEPGSTGKVVTMAALLESGTATPGSRYGVDYTYTIDGQKFKDSHYHGREKLTLAGILAESSNAGTVQAASKMTPQVQYDYLKAFGLGSPTGLGLPGESAGILRTPAQWDGRTRYTVTFGQGLSANAVQIASVYSTIANGGVRETPHLVAGTTGADGVTAPASEPAGKRVVSEKTAKQLTRMLAGVVDDEQGTGAAAAVPGYQVAGKTGTAEAAGSGGRLSKYVASFVGFAPADKPRLTVGVFVMNPHTSIYGGVTAAPVFSKVMGFALDDLGVPPTSSKVKPYAPTW